MGPGLRGCQEIGCIAAVRASRRTPRVLLSMREAFDGIKKIPHPEEAAKQLSRRTRALVQPIVNFLTAAFAGKTRAGASR